jgi:hypothetical protein
MSKNMRGIERILEYIDRVPYEAYRFKLKLVILDNFEKLSIKYIALC